MKFNFIQANCCEFPVTRLCDVLKVKRGSYYAWLSRPKSQYVEANENLLEEIKKIHKKSRGTYGSPRIHKALNDAGEKYGLNRVASLMAAANIVKILRHLGLPAIAPPRAPANYSSFFDPF